MEKVLILLSFILWKTYSQECGSVLQSAELRLRNPEYPKPLAPGVFCDWILKAAASDICKLEVEYLVADLQDSTLVIDGAPLSGSLAGVQTFYVHGNTSIHFRSGNLPGRGFDIVLRQKACPTTPTRCGSILTDVEGVISGPGLSDDCSYTIKQQDSSYCEVKVKFTNFYIESGASCLDSRVEINEDVLCDRIDDERTYRFVDGKVEVKYRSSGRSNANRYSLKLSQVSCPQKVEEFDVDANITESPSNFLYNYMPAFPSNFNFGTCCDGIHSERRFLIASPGFPFSNNVDCVYTIRKYGPSTQYLQLKFRYFWIGDRDEYYGCYGGSLEIDGTLFCGCQTGLVWTTWFNFNGYSDYKTIRLVINQPNRNRFIGFVVEVVQCDFLDPSFRFRRDLFIPENSNFTGLISDGKRETNNSEKASSYTKMRDGRSRQFERFGVVPDIRCISWNLNDWLVVLQEAVSTQLQCPVQSQITVQSKQKYLRNDAANCTEYRTDHGLIKTVGTPSYGQTECFRINQLLNMCALDIIFHEFHMSVSEGCYVDFIYISGVGKFCKIPQTNNTVHVDWKSNHVDIIAQGDSKTARILLEFRQLPCTTPP